MRISTLKSLFAAVCLLCSLNASAIFNSNGIFYDIISDTDLTVSVTYDQDTYYSGNVVIPATVQNENKTYKVVEVGYLAFESCWGVQSVTLPEGLKTIGDYAFSSCTSLKSIELPSTVTKIGEFAFQGCSELASITLSKSLSFVDQNAFKECNKLAEVNVNDLETLLNVKYVNEKSNPLYFAHNLKLKGELVTTFNAPETATAINAYALLGCTSVQNINLGSKIETIGDHAFEGCVNVKSLVIPNSVKTIKTWAFRDCKGLESVTIGNKVDSIAGYAFTGCEALKSISFPDNVTYLGESVMSRCKGLQNITIGKGIKDVLSYSFENCAELASVVLGENVESIGYNAFNGCAKLSEITFSDKVRNIDASAFNGTAWLNNQEEGIVYAGPVAFKYKGGMPQGTNISFKEGTKAIANDLFYYFGSSIASVQFPSSLEVIGTWAFYKAVNLKDVVIPDNVEIVGERAFSNCTNLESVIFGKNFRELGDGTFVDVPNLKNVTVKAVNVPDFNLSIWDPTQPFMSDVYTKATLTVPAEVVEAYKADKNWGQFANIVAGEAGVENLANDNISIKAINGNIVVEADENALVTVYNVNGQVVYNGAEKTVAVEQPGMYIVRVNDKVQKVIL